MNCFCSFEKFLVLYELSDGLATRLATRIATGLATGLAT
jgi:uncharacterized membrane protein YcjF (UPF0283 family)